MSSLNPKQFWYHGSKRNLTPGVDQILPANDDRVGGSHYGYSRHDDWHAGGWDEPDGSSRGDWTFAADTEEEAEAWVPFGPGRPATYVVQPRDDTDTDIETQHHETNYSFGEHIKARGPMDIVDRIDIPRPNHPDEVVQGTLPPQNWGLLNGLPKGYEGPATVGEQNPETDNFKRISPAYERHVAERDEEMAEFDAKDERVGYEARWRKAGQQSLFDAGEPHTRAEHNAAVADAHPNPAVAERIRNIAREYER